MLAVQGPRSAELLGAARAADRARLHGFVGADWNGDRAGGLPDRLHRRARLRAAAAGWDDAGALWDALLARARTLGVQPCGLGARDTLRTEMGYPLHGQDLSLEITPVQARSGWAVGWKKPAFWGRDALLAERERGSGPAAVGPRGAGPRHPARRTWRCSADGDRGRRGHQRDVLADPEEGHRPGPAVDRRRVGEGDEVRGRRARPAGAGPRRQAAVRAVARALTRGPTPSDPPPLRSFPWRYVSASAGGAET